MDVQNTCVSFMRNLLAHQFGGAGVGVCVCECAHDTKNEFMIMFSPAFSVYSFVDFCIFRGRLLARSFSLFFYSKLFIIVFGSMRSNGRVWQPCKRRNLFVSFVRSLLEPFHVCHFTSEIVYFHLTRAHIA